MLKSMTGFGKSQVSFGEKTIVTEIRTLNSKQTDIGLRIPVQYREKEPELRSMLMDRLNRGKVELTITIENGGDQSGFAINKKLAQRYYQEFRALSAELEGTSLEDFFQVLVRLPDVIQPEVEQLSHEEWQVVRDSVSEALEMVDKYRIEEARQMREEFDDRISLILEKLRNVDQYEKIRVERIRSKLLKGYNELNQGLDHDENRFEQELLFYIEKLDISEEKQRLRKNCELFIDTMNQDQSQGKKLNFITQEIGREINTLGSKANDADIQRLVVDMKDDLEKIREQLFNIL